MTTREIFQTLRAGMVTRTVLAGIALGFVGLCLLGRRAARTGFGITTGYPMKFTTRLILLVTVLTVGSTLLTTLLLMFLYNVLQFVYDL